jgi:hypothetical protein
MSDPEALAQLILVREVGDRGSVKWFNFFLTASYTLVLDYCEDQHDLAMQRLGIDPQSVLESGHVNVHGALFRSSPAMDRREIDEEHHLALILAIRQLLRERRACPV